MKAEIEMQLIPPQSLRDRLLSLHALECWGASTRGFIYMSACSHCAERMKREPDKAAFIKQCWSIETADNT